ncbi:MAG TPA: hypothetical protein VLT15_06605 [Acidimicrobiia bacterium]|nr:hypothetical protein [Acidimicrobiia bacterium]
MTVEAHPPQKHGEVDEKKFGRAIATSIAVGTPLSIILIVLAMWIFTDSDLGRAFSTAIWPGILTGVFGGGFIGVIIGSGSAGVDGS